MQMDKTRVWHRPEWTMFPIYLCLLTVPRKRVCQRAFNDSMFAVTNNDKIFSWQRELSSDSTLKTGWVLSTYSGKYNCEERFNNFLCCWRFSPPSSVSFQKRILIRYQHRSRSETRTRMGGNNSPPTTTHFESENDDDIRYKFVCRFANPFHNLYNFWCSLCINYLNV